MALARILVYEPDVIMLDEPFSALDYYLKEQLQFQVREVLRGYTGDVADGQPQPGRGLSVLREEHHLKPRTGGDEGRDAGDFSETGKCHCGTPDRL